MRSTFLMLGAATALAMTVLSSTAPPAKATTYDLYTQTVDQVNGFDFNVVLTTDGSNLVTAAGGTIIGLGSNAAFSGTINGFLPAPGDGIWAINNVYVPVAPYFTQDALSGIVLYYILNSNGGTSSVSLYNDPSNGQDWASFYPSPGTYQLNLAASHDPPATPLPGTLSLFVGGLGVIGLLVGKRKKHRT